MPLMDLLFKKAPRAKQTCNYCNSSRWGLARPNWPFCKKKCKEAFKEATERPPDQFEMPLLRPP